jgi:predicted RNA-binding Zn-ribbon protein involved in translation (DUF1610 family)
MSWHGRQDVLTASGHRVRVTEDILIEIEQRNCPVSGKEGWYVCDDANFLEGYGNTKEEKTTPRDVPSQFNSLFNLNPNILFSTKKMARDYIHRQIKAKCFEILAYQEQQHRPGEDVETTTFCGEDIDTFTDDYKYWNYCPHCGGKMIKQIKKGGNHE